MHLLVNYYKLDIMNAHNAHNAAWRARHAAHTHTPHLPQYCVNYKDIFLLNVSTKK